ncbi:hypothetical protein GALL_540180 [mine drainage metagenome]|uniref:Uncharacterized protein n=1 Tax=mine drainage metagenome TaxID=410659 RepID=A0A1J5P9E8_9ZZZZ
MHELAVRQSDEQREYHAEMQRQQGAHRWRIAPEQERDAGDAGQKQHDDEGDVHAGAFLVDQRRIALEFFRE